MFTVICVRVMVSVSRKLFFAISLNVFKNWFWKIDSFLLIIPLLGHIMIQHIAFYVKWWGCLSNMLLLWQCAPPAPRYWWCCQAVSTDEARSEYLCDLLGETQPSYWFAISEGTKISTRISNRFLLPHCLHRQKFLRNHQPLPCPGSLSLPPGHFCWRFNLCAFVRAPLCPAVPSWAAVP